MLERVQEVYKVHHRKVHLNKSNVRGMWANKIHIVDSFSRLLPFGNGTMSRMFYNANIDLLRLRSYMQYEFLFMMTHYICAWQNCVYARLLGFTRGFFIVHNVIPQSNTFRLALLPIQGFRALMSVFKELRKRGKGGLTQ